MRERRLDFRGGRRLPPWLFGDSAGVQISGDSGSGKSNALEVILQHILRHFSRHSRPSGLLVIDPHGSTARRLRRFCLSLGPSVARRVVYIRWSDTERLVSINPLHVPGEDVGSLRWYGRLAVITELVSKILLAAWGETDFNSKPILFKNVFRIVYTLAHAGLALADARLFLDLASPVYQTLCRAVPDLIARQEMEELPELRQADRLAQIESAKNRFLGFLSNRIVEAILGRVEGALSMQRLYDEQAIVLVNLETGGVLRTMDQEILANLLLTLALVTIMNTPERQRHPYFIAIDELPVFRSSFELLLTVLGQARKFLAGGALLACHQGCNLFPDRTDDRLLHALVSQCRTHLYFRHGAESDATFFGKIIALPDFSATKIKHVQRQPMQFQEGHNLVTLFDESETMTEGDTTGGSDTAGTTDTSSWNTATTQSDTRSESVQRDEERLRELVSEARAQATGHQSGSGGATAKSHQQSSTWSRTSSRGRGLTRKQQLVPVIRTREVVTSVQFFTKEELDALAATTIAWLKTGRAVLHVSGHSPVEVAFPLATDPYTRTPKFAAKKEATHQAALEQRPEYAAIEAIRQERQQVLDALLARLCATEGDLSVAAGLPAAPAVLNTAGDRRAAQEPVGCPVRQPGSDGTITI